MPVMSNPLDRRPRVLVLGAYGLIGAGIMRHLAARDRAVTGLGRDARVAERVLPGASWVIRDLRELCAPADWAPLIDGFDFVVNCAGALQDGGGDDLAAVQHHAIAALAGACAASAVGLVQISAVGAEPEATTAFLRTKAAADAAIRESGANYWIYRPGLVLAPNAYGGTALIRMLAAVPQVQPLARGEARVQTVALSDVVRAVELAVLGEIPSRTECDLVEEEPHTFAEIVGAHRQWLGNPAPRRALILPEWMLSVAARGADALGRLGWRSPLRSTALKVLADGVLGDPGPWRRLGQPPLAGVYATLRAMPATAEHRMFARMALLAPVVIAVLFVFWLASGVIGLVYLDGAASVLVEAGWSWDLARMSVIFWALVDIAIAGGLLVRRHARRACLAMIAVSLVYVVSSTVFVPGLWLDPLGALVKVLPSMALAALAIVMLETR